ncbi:LANO_0D01816g1_1 [Lachancea nothofagi CBS 11611]|uniref:LANO_0D01816g1_1 n=1 Tax=Lachancea nothofagi CBS 11611 TaxID=1266666 RepID=A0A1G4JDX7_9SACH|nr:LANO_0D01816g1_1 [Lachancea nothofagi CBS 11611]
MVVNLHSLALTMAQFNSLSNRATLLPCVSQQCCFLSRSVPPYRAPLSILVLLLFTHTQAWFWPLPITKSRLRVHVSPRSHHDFRLLSLPPWPGKTFFRAHASSRINSRFFLAPRPIGTSGSASAVEVFPVPDTSLPGETETARQRRTKAYFSTIKVFPSCSCVSWIWHRSLRASSSSSSSRNTAQLQGNKLRYPQPTIIRTVVLTETIPVGQE